MADRGIRDRIGIGLVVYVFGAIALLAMSRLEHWTVTQFRWYAASALAPILGAANDGLQYVKRARSAASSIMELTGEVERLKSENQKLKGWEWRAKESERKLADLSNLTSVVRELPAGFVTGRVLASATGPFAQSALINAGRDQNVKNGFPVLSSAGLVGRVVETGKSASQILLLTDLNSRIPVIVGQRAVQAVMVGDRSPFPRLAYLASESPIEQGDEVVTSGVGGLFPRGLRIGVVVARDHGLSVRPHAELDNLEYLSVLFHETPTLGLTDPASAEVKTEARREITPELPAAVHDSR